MRKRRSKYDPYLEDIADMIAAGCTYAQIEEALWEKGLESANSGSIAYICHEKGIRSRVTKGARDGRYIPCCDGCENCRDVRNTTGKSVWICTRLMRLVSKSVKTSPVECPKRREKLEEDVKG